MPRVADCNKVAVWRGAERGNPVDGGFYALDGVVVLEEDLLGVHKRVKRKASIRAGADLRLRAREQLDVLVLGVTASREGKAVLDRLCVNRHDWILVGGELAILNHLPLSAKRL